MALAFPEQHAEISKMVTKNPLPPRDTKVFRVTNVDAEKAALWLSAMYPDTKVGGPVIQGDSANNQILVISSPEQVKEIEAIITVIKADPTGGGGNFRVISLGEGSAASLAEALQKFFSEMRPENPVRILTPGGGPKWLRLRRLARASRPARGPSRAPASRCSRRHRLHGV